ncbi:MAG: hypothetical protein IPL61_38640 [Myxococcales bacterium]|nr:hypothetical protein [Myxococcales bacterium]
MPGLQHACALIALAGAAGCLDVPPYRPCAGDGDCDGWPAVAANPAANDCDDDNALVHPGAEDDPGTTVVEDCFASALATPLTPVAPLARGWTVGDLVLEFDSTSAMPSSLRRGADEVLAGNNDSCVRDERFAGISMYPAFGVDGRSSQVGQATTLRSGPALATTRVTWEQAVPVAATVFGCDAATTVTGVVDFTVQPSGRIVRRDQVTLSAGVMTCAGCADPDGNPAILTSYFTFPTALDRYQVDPATVPGPFPAVGAAAKLSAPAAPITACISGAGSALPQVGLAWSFPTAIAGMRARTTDDTRANRAMVVDWVNRGGAAAGAYELVTAVAVETDRVADCSRELRVAMTEFARPPTLTPTTFVPARGTYRFSGEVGAGVMITADQGVERGAVIEVPTFGQRGLTVWTSSGGGAYQRSRRGQDYLVQYEADDTSVVYLPTITAGSSIVIAGPGGEPPP